MVVGSRTVPSIALECHSSLIADALGRLKGQGPPYGWHMPENKNPPYLITFLLKATLRGSVGILFLEASIGTGWKNCWCPQSCMVLPSSYASCKNLQVATMHERFAVVSEDCLKILQCDHRMAGMAHHVQGWTCPIDMACTHCSHNVTALP